MADEEQDQEQDQEQQEPQTRSEKKAAAKAAKSDKKPLNPLDTKIMELTKYCGDNKEQFGFGTAQKAVYAERVAQLEFLWSLKKKG